MASRDSDVTRLEMSAVIGYSVDVGTWRGTCQRRHVPRGSMTVDGRHLFAASALSGVRWSREACGDEMRVL